jgi:hypothetical protein
MFTSNNTPRLIDVLFVDRYLLSVRPCVVERQVQPTKLHHRPFYQRFHVSGFAHVGLLEHGPAPALSDKLNDLFALCGIPVANH